MPRDLEAVIRIGADLDKSLRGAIEQAAQRIESLQDVTEASTRAFDVLSDTLDAQSDALKSAKKQYASYVLNGEKGSDQAEELAQKIKKLSSELSENRARLKAAEKAADSLDDSMDEMGDSVRDAGDGFTVMKGAMANLVSSGIQSLISGCANAISSVYGLAESTREFRQDMGTLETAYDRAGFSAETATETWKDLYSIFGEDDRAVEAANNIARIADSQADLEKWTKITTGIWGTYQDALPVESLAEAASETINTGKVTGTLADALNWSSEAAVMFADYMSEDVTTAEDAFNVALSMCTSEAERNALVTSTLTKLYGAAADKYEETAESIIEANKATADMTLTQAELGERIEPVTTAVRSGLAGLLASAIDLIGGADLGAFADKITGAFQTLGDIIFPLAKQILPPLGNAVTTVFNALTPLLPTVSNFLGSLLPPLAEAINLIVAAIAPVIPIIGEIVDALLPALSALISGLSPAISTLLSALTPVIAAASKIISAILPPITMLIDMVSSSIQFLANVISGSLESTMQSVQPIINGVTGVLDNLMSFIDNIFTGNWEAAWENVKGIFSSAFQALAGIVKAPINGVISIINGAISGINSIGFDIPDWVPLIGGKAFRIDIPKIPLLASGGFTDGVSIAGEAGTEAVISFDRSVREANLGYWAKAGRLLGATADDAGFSLSGEAGGGATIDMGGVTFAPNITISGRADRESVIKAIEDEYPEFLDMLERWLLERGATVYA